MDKETLSKRIKEAIEKMPTELDALIERGKAMQELSANPEGAIPIRKRLKLKGSSFYNYADGSGNSESLWIMSHNGILEALYLCYDHESALNFYAFDNGKDAYSYQDRLYRDVPSNLKWLLYNGPQGELLTIQSPDGESELYHGSAVLYLKDGKWSAPESYIDLAIELDSDDGGLSYILTDEELSESENN